MKSNILAAVILAVGLILAAVLHSGRYYALTADKGVVVRIDRWTGEVEIIRTQQHPDFEEF